MKYFSTTGQGYVKLAHTKVPAGYEVQGQSLNITHTGDEGAIVLINIENSGFQNPSPEVVLQYLGLQPVRANSLVSRDIFDYILSPGVFIAFLSFKTVKDASELVNTYEDQDDARIRQERVIRDYVMCNRNESPQYYPEAEWRAT